jgi:hypothetical protein
MRPTAATRLPRGPREVVDRQHRRDRRQEILENGLTQAQAPERRSNWNFVITDSGWLWTVTRPDGTEDRAEKSFKTLKQAADDAIAHGYGAWKGDERRSVPDL